MKDSLKNFKLPMCEDSYFITLEGIEGAGKSTQIDSISSFFKERNYNVTLLREPGGTLFGEGLRQAILSSETELAPVSEAYLFAASRAQLLKEKILPVLAIPRNIVICDRYIDSSIAYQGNAAGLGIENIIKIHQLPPLNILPNLTLYIRISLETSVQRQKIRNSKQDYFEAQGEEFYKKLIDGYEQAAEIFPKRIRPIDGEGSEKEIFERIRPLLEEMTSE